MTSIRSLALTVLLAIGLVSSAGLAPVSAAPADRTTITMRVIGCEGCEVQPIRARSGRTGTVRVFPARVVRDGKVTFTVPRRHTDGLSFTVDDEGAVFTGAHTLAVVRYQDVRAGTSPSRKQAARATRAFHCLARLPKGRVTLTLRVDRYPGTDVVTGEEGYQIRPYLAPARRPVGKAQRAYDGVVGAQDHVYCA